MTIKKLNEELKQLIKEATKDFEQLKSEVAEDTEYNCHTEALLAIANYYNMEEYIPYLTELQEYQDSPKYFGLTPDQVEERLDIQHKMFDDLEKQIGEEQAKELYSCL